MSQRHSSRLSWRGGASRLWSLVPGYAVLAHAQPLGCPGVTRSLPKPYWARLTLLGRSEGCRGVPKSPGIKSSHHHILLPHLLLIILHGYRTYFIH